MTGHFKSNLRDLLFNVLEWAPSRELLGTGPFEDFDAQTVRDILGEVASLAEGPLADTYTVADRHPPVFDPASASVSLPEAFRKGYEVLRASEWWRLETLPELGGQAAPRTLMWSVNELLLGANPALQMYLSGPSFAGVVYRNGNEAQRRLAQLIIDRGWGTTMVLTEPDAGSDVGAIRTRATPGPDGTWHIDGVKRFITNAEHDMADNIVHLVLARPEGAGAGTQGLSLFIVPKFHIDLDTGELGDRNGVFVTGVERKMGLKGSVTGELSFGQQADHPAVGWLLGDVHKGIVQMFQIIEHSRMSVGTKAIATLSTGYLNALDFAKSRIQSADLKQAGVPSAPRVAIIRHPEVRRSLMLTKAYAEGLRALIHYAASVQDRITVQGSSDDVALNQLLLPVVKGVGSERAYEQLGHALVILGGSGYLQDYPLEQYIRDTRIDGIYEGTTAIQGHDLLFRRVLRDGGQTLSRLSSEILSFVDEAQDSELAVPRDALREAVQTVDAMAAELLGTFALSRSEQPEQVYRVGQHATSFLMAVGDLMIGYLLTHQAQTAVRRLEAADLVEADRAFYQGKIAVAQFFAVTVLPELAARLRVVQTESHSLMDVDERSF